MMAIAVVLFFSGSAIATPVFEDGGAGLQGVLDDITTAPVAGNSSIDVTTDYLDYDERWDITASGGSVTTMVIELAGFKHDNTFGVYDGTEYVEIFAGIEGAGTLKTLAITSLGDVYINSVDSGQNFTSESFGYYLETPEGNIWHSEVSRNSDGNDHMLAYQGTGVDTVEIFPWSPGTWSDNEFILAFEDKTYTDLGADFDDMVVMVESVEPVPEPTTLILFGSGLLGLCAYARKRRKN